MSKTPVYGRAFDSPTHLTDGWPGSAKVRWR